MPKRIRATVAAQRPRQERSPKHNPPAPDSRRPDRAASCDESLGLSWARRRPDLDGIESKRDLELQVEDLDLVHFIVGGEGGRERGGALGGWRTQGLDLVRQRAQGGGRIDGGRAFDRRERGV